MKLSANSLKDLLIHLAIMITIIVALVLFFFYGYLPSTTNHGETITVPKLIGEHYEKLEEKVIKRKLRYEVTSDSGYDTNYPPLTVLTQYPKAEAMVKENRKVFIQLNAVQPPMMKMPNLIQASTAFAKSQLESLGLKVNNLSYRPDVAENRVLEQLYNGENIEPGTDIAKGSGIDLVIGNGYGNRRFQVPDVEGMSFDVAETVILGSNLRVGLTISVKDETDTLEAGTVIKQRPKAEEEVRTGEEIDLWVIEMDSSDIVIDPNLDGE